ncbi:hypothetical protein CKY20_10930 [Capnocytophaga canis]|uniref:Teneurin-like YD-shell domain-containing protein n=2 Tax=Capnocytophaga canis TaxID=1848903 RepID=A0A3A1YDU0_9FLAO|nr:hypothetical protein CKY20_10930 [Capnocytophaga canis]
MLKAVQRPDGSVITFKYDAFGRRISKKYLRREFLYIWDKNVPLHEIQKEELCEDNIITWIFDGFTPTAKLINGKAYSIISDHIGTPILAVDTNGVKVWERELDIYGRVRKEFTSDDVKDRRCGFMPFLYAGQYYDKETELAYNRFRYYSPDIGVYISQDPIGLWGGDNLYAYVHNSNLLIDVLGLAGAKIATLTLTNGNVYEATSGGKNTLTTDKIFDEIVVKAAEKANEIEKARYYGECAEINAIKKALSEGETLKTLEDSTMNTRFNKNRKEKVNMKAAKKGDPAEACECCKIVLQELSITDKNKGCGNR